MKMLVRTSGQRLRGFERSLERFYETGAPLSPFDKLRVRKL